MKFLKEFGNLDDYKNVVIADSLDLPSVARIPENNEYKAFFNPKDKEDITISDIPENVSCSAETVEVTVNMMKGKQLTNGDFVGKVVKDEKHSITIGKNYYPMEVNKEASITLSGIEKSCNVLQDSSYYVKAIFRNTNTEDEVTVASNLNQLNESNAKIYIDGNLVSVSKAITFDSVGNHEVYFTFPISSAITIPCFSNCSHLLSLDLSHLPSQITSLPNGLCYNCTALSNVILNKGITTIPSSAFTDCYSLLSLDIPDSVTRISTAAFSYCTSLRTITLNNLKYVESSGFCVCRKLSFTMPESLLSVGQAGFYDCENLDWDITNIVQNLYLDRYAFAGASKIHGQVVWRKSLYDYCFAWTSIDNLTLGSGLTSMGYYSFTYCPLTSVTFEGEIKSINLRGCKFESFIVPEGVTSVDFSYSTSLTSVTLPSTVTSIPYQAFYCCSNLKEIKCNGTIKSIGQQAFYHSGLESINLEEGLTSIGESAFSYCYNLKEITLPESLGTTWNTSWFYGSSIDVLTINMPITAVSYTQQFRGAKKLILPDTITNICSSGFCFSGIEEIEIPDSVISIGAAAFYYASSLKKITIGSGITEIPVNCFRSCSQLEDVIINGQITSIGQCAFCETPRLKNINFPSSLQSIAASAFTQSLYSCPILDFSSFDHIPSLAEQYAFAIPENWYGIIPYCLRFIVPDTLIDEWKSTTNWSTYSGRTYTSDSCPMYNDNDIIYSASGITSAITLTYGGYVSVTGASSAVTSLDLSTYYSCLVRKINIQGTVGGNILACKPAKSLLEEINFPEDIGSGCSIENAVSGYKVDTFTIPDSIISARTYFGRYSSMNTLVVGSGLTGPTDTYCYYFTETQAKKVIIREGSTAVTCQEFMKASSLKEVVLPSTMKIIGNYGFADDGVLDTIIFPSGLETIGNYAFRSCSGLTSISLPDTLSALGAGAFYNCRGLKEVTIPGSIKTIGSGAFAECSALTKVVIEDGVEVIAANAFANCESLKEVVLPNSIKEIQSLAFSCTPIPHLNIPTSLVKLSNSAFLSASSLDNTVEFYTKASSNDAPGFWGVEVFSSITISDDVTSLPAFETTVEGTGVYNAYGSFGANHTIKQIIMPPYLESISGYSYNYPFSSCTVLELIDFRKATMIPTLSSDMIKFSPITVILVPANLYNDWISAPRWSNFVKQIVPDFTPQECTSLSIIGDDCGGRATSTTVHYTAICNGINTDGDYVSGLTVSSTGMSSTFEQNADTENTVQRTVSFTYLDKTATTTITQGVWVDQSVTVDTTQWQVATTYSSPDTNYDMYESFSNYNVANSSAVTTISIVGFETFTMYIGSYAESSCDYTVASQIDSTVSAATTQSKQYAPTSLSNMTKLEYTDLGGDEHTITVYYRKDGSVNSNADRGYLLVPKI